MKGAALGFVLLVAWSRPAAAHIRCGKEPPPTPGPVGLRAPASGSTDVPLDTLIWGGGFGEVLIDQHGVEVPLIAAGEIDEAGATLSLWRPAHLLAPDTIYQYWYCTPDACVSLISEFRTGTELAAPPDVPVLLSQDPSETPEYRVYLSFDFAGVLVVADADSDFDGDTLQGRILASSGDPAEPLRLAENCGTSRWPYRSRSADLKFAAFSLAGEFSGWSEPELVTARTGCSIDRDGAPLALCALLGLRRRRRAARAEHSGASDQ